LFAGVVARAGRATVAAEKSGWLPKQDAALATFKQSGIAEIKPALGQIDDKEKGMCVPFDFRSTARARVESRYAKEPVDVHRA
jgi:hypothetical protein